MFMFKYRIRSLYSVLDETQNQYVKSKYFLHRTHIPVQLTDSL